jgi:hypothetical protein
LRDCNNEYFKAGFKQNLQATAFVLIFIAAMESMLWKMLFILPSLKWPGGRGDSRIFRFDEFSIMHANGLPGGRRL